METASVLVERLKQSVNRRRLVDTVKQLVSVPSPTGAAGAVSVLWRLGVGVGLSAGVVGAILSRGIFLRWLTRARGDAQREKGKHRPTRVRGPRSIRYAAIRRGA